MFSYVSMPSRPAWLNRIATRSLYTPTRSKGVIRPRPMQETVETPDLSLLPPPVPVDQLAYRVRRTKLAKWLPVYTQYRNGRSRVLTIVRRIDGNVEQLKQDLSAVIPPERIKVHPLTKHLIVNGNYVNVMRDWLTRAGF